MISITEAQPNEFNIIQHIAFTTWPVCYHAILSDEQLEYMLGKFYTLEALNQNVEEGHHFLLIKQDDVVLGFAAYQHRYMNRDVTRIHKIYVLPDTQGKGLGKLLIAEIEHHAAKSGSDTLSLNVNRFNSAKTFYEKLGFEVVGEEDIAIGEGWLMEDYRMEKKI